MCSPPHSKAPAPPARLRLPGRSYFIVGVYSEPEALRQAGPRLLPRPGTDLTVPDFASLKLTRAGRLVDSRTGTTAFRFCWYRYWCVPRRFMTPSSCEPRPYRASPAPRRIPAWRDRQFDRRPGGDMLHPCAHAVRAALRAEFRRFVEYGSGNIHGNKGLAAPLWGSRARAAPWLSVYVSAPVSLSISTWRQSVQSSSEPGNSSTSQSTSSQRAAAPQGWA